MLRRLLAFSFALCLASSRARAQFAWRPDADWRTLRTEHFTIDYPRDFDEWARAMAERLESVRGAVGREVGSLPRRRVTVLVTDPYSVSNGSAWPFLESPAIIVWPTPPDPRSSIGDARSWPEILAVHEFAHLAHLTRPSRNPTQRLLARLSPLGIGPLVVKSPRWVIEGYATFVEGRLTGSGRPHGVWRPAVLRQWAIEGRLPSYGQLSSDDEYEGGSFAYLGGSAFLEWLAARRGDSTLVQLWRRMSARTDRSFDAAFAGLYGDTPRALYGRFSAELTGKALQVERTLRDSGLVEGTLVQRLAWTTGDPAVSPGGDRVALVLRSKDHPSRLVIWRTADEPPDTTAAARQARERAARRDPEDVPDVPFWPRAKRPVATLFPANGLAYDAPRFFADGQRLLVVRDDVRPDGSLVPDLFEWTPRTKSVRRVTRGAGIQMADPSPDGRSAAAIRCAAGRCDLVRVTLASGAVETLAAGSPTRSYTHPRWAPDGRTIVASVSDSGVWRLVERHEDGTLRYLGPDDGVNRYDPEYARDGSLLHVSEAGGIPNLALLDTTTNATRTLTRVTGAAVAPSAGRGREVFFLSLHATGYDVRRLSLDSLRDAHPIALDSTLAPATQRPVVATDSFARLPLGSSRPYGIGDRDFRLTTGYSLAADGREISLGLSSTDKVGRFAWLAQGALGTVSRPRGGALAAAWRGWPLPLEGEVFGLQRDASREKPAGFTGPLDDVALRGATLALRADRDASGGEIGARLGGSLQRVGIAAASPVPRPIGFMDLDAQLVQRGDQHVNRESLRMHLVGGRDRASSDPPSFTRWEGTASLETGDPSGPLVLEGSYGAVHGGGPFEQFVLGGAEPAFVDPATLDQWVAMPALPFGMLRGTRYASYRVALGGDALSPYYWAGAAGTGGTALGRWKRVVGVDGSVAVPPVPVLRLPATALVAGAGYSLDEPWRKKLRAYLSLRYRP